MSWNSVIVKAEVWINVPTELDNNKCATNDQKINAHIEAQYTGLMLLGSLLSDSFVDIRKIRMPDSTNPNDAGTLNFVPKIIPKQNVCDC